MSRNIVLILADNLGWGELCGYGGGAPAVSTTKRSALLPNLPTTADAGITGYETTNWSGLLAPAATPRAIIEQLNAAINTGMSRPDVRERLVALGHDGRPVWRNTGMLNQ